MSDTIFQNLIDNTRDLRRRLLWSILSISIFAGGTYYFRGYVLDFIQRPLTDKKLIFIHPTEAFFTYIKVSLFVGLIVSAPFILYQIIQLLVPYMEDNEKYSRGFLASIFISGSVFFYLGAGFALLGVLPFALDFLKGVSGENVQATFTIGNYASFVMLFTLIFGLVFEMPVVSYGLAKLGLIDKKTLTSKWRIAFVGAAVLAAVLTPPDPITQMFLWGPLLLLYGISIVLVGLANRDEQS
ncbi:MAG: twin-arginine translocase subunit TatC [Candidatus Acetothermia bacterium]|nr:twin-arginine translocase subunit TatC [Candidatus Bipolaricaulota bacterium]